MIYVMCFLFQDFLKISSQLIDGASEVFLRLLDCVPAELWSDLILNMKLLSINKEEWYLK